MSTTDTDNKDSKLTAKEEYELIINARNFHYQEFNKWSRYFGLVVSALLVAYYGTETNKGFQILVATLGYIVSLCWYWSNKGYTYWWIHWSKYLMYVEKQLPHNFSENSGVYGSFCQTKGEKKYKIDEGNYFRVVVGANISTSKIVLLMSFIIACAWGAVFLNSVIFNSSLIKDNMAIMRLILSVQNIIVPLIEIKKYIIDNNLVMLCSFLITYIISIIGALCVKSDLSKHIPIGIYFYS